MSCTFRPNCVKFLRFKEKKIYKFYFQSIVYLSPRPSLIGKTKHEIIGLILGILFCFNSLSVCCKLHR